MKSFALLGLASLLCSCANREPDCGITDVDYTAAGPWYGLVKLQATDYTGASGGKFVIDGRVIELGPDLMAVYDCAPGRHSVLLEVEVEDYVLCERGHFYCR